MNVYLGLALTFLLLAANAFFVASEFAVTSSRRSNIEPLAEQGRRGAEQALYALEHVSLMLAIAQLGITVMSTSLGVIAEPAISHLIEAPLLAVGAPPGVVRATGFVLALLIVLFLHVVFGEMMPKNVTIARSTQSLLLLAPALVTLGRALGPLVRALDSLANWFIRKAGMEPKSEIAATFTVEEVASIVEVSQEVGKLHDDLGLLSGTLQFGDLKVADLMVPLEKLTTLQAPVTPQEVEQGVAKTGFSRFPVTGSAGQLEGYIHLKDVLYAEAGQHDKPVEAWRIRTLGAIDPDVEAGEALRQMQATANHLLSVVEGDHVVGILFLEDLLEELVGRVEDSLQRYPQE